ncbi:prolactin receptor a [Megalobrama amblycephala]|uniref:prolactin receptor a n=1 Tax=Megalobrama amblycephala TaxID=75352 RepID=UPI002013EF08|nr:prolactin receptor a [Megalobrama amblycephala]
MRNSWAVLSLTFIANLISQAAGVSPPGKARLTSCRSPEKETFTCWWEPGDDGGLPTTYALYYRLEQSETVYECPDYRTAGENSCFFNKNYTSIWVNYNITVVSTNALGKNISDPVEVDVTYIVQPKSPENVTAVVVHEDQGPFVKVLWEKPRTADTRSGWITLLYQLRVKQEKDKEWVEYDAGRQKYYNVFSLHPGKYMVQVRCKPDHGFWSEWTKTTYIKMPDYLPKERSLWIMITVFSVFIVLILIWMLKMKRNSVKLCLLPPVPGPKIKGFDKQLLKSGKSEEIFNSLVIQGFPPTTDYDDLLVEYLEVYDNEQQELVLDGKDLSEDCIKSKSPSDCDSGRGSCDSRTLLLEKCIEGREGSGSDQHQYSQHGETSWASTESSESQGPEPSSPESVDGRVKTWPIVCSSPEPQPYHHYQAGSAKPAYHSVPEIHSHLSPHATASNYHQLHHQDIPPQEVLFSKPACSHSQSYNQFNLDGSDTPAHGVPPSRSLGYVEVQRVNPENMLLLRPLSDPNRELEGSDCIGEDYSKVKEVTSNNILFLQRETSHQCVDNYSLDLDSQADQCTSQQPPHPCKPAVHQSYSLMPEEGMRVMGNGYVDSTVLMPSY